jgi:predicted HTH transcriptional regulator
MSATPRVQDKVRSLLEQGEKSAVIEIPKGNQRPYQTTDHQFLVRVGSTNRVATQAELKVIEGNIDQQVDTASVLIRNYMHNPSTIVGNQRIETQPHFSDKVIRELLVNAVVHRNYSILGSRIRVFMFDHRMEIRSPGRLLNTINIEKIRTGVTYAINPVLVKFMENLRYIDKLGRGIPMV